MKVKLTVFQHSKQIQELELEPTHEYVIGRDSTCDIVIDGQRGISRQHAKLTFAENSWTVSLISKFGSLIIDGQTAEQIQLFDGAEFSIPPFRFALAMPEKKAEPKELTRLTHEHTSVNTSTTTPFIKVIDKGRGQEDVFRLEGNAWTVGRDATCEIPVDNPLVSRRHLEISKSSEGQYFATDLGSANGTQLNGEALAPNEAIQIVSGDTLSIMSIQLSFEIRDPQFDRKLATIPQQQHLLPLQDLENLPQALSTPQPNQDPFADYATSATPGALKVSAKSFKLDAQFMAKHKVRIAIAVFAVLLVYGLMDSPTEGKKDLVSTQPEAAKFENLTPEQKTSVKDTFNLASNLYLQGKYSLCTEELKKLHEIVPFYENSKELASHCVQGEAILTEQLEKERQEAEKRKSTALIQAEVQRCRELLTKSTSESDAKECLGQAIELDPQHPEIVQLILEVNNRALEKVRTQNEEDDKRKSAAAAQSIFDRAKQLATSGSLAKAIAEYEKLIRGNYTTSSNLRSLAQREVASVRAQLDKKVSALLSSCKQNLEQNKYKLAYLDCDQALKENPKSAEASQLRQQALSEMKRELKSIYEDSVIEETMGNIEVAKEKWKKIIEEDLPSGEYQNKARSNLRKYGVGL